MALQRTKLADIQYVPASPGSVYSNPSSTKTFVKGLLIFNGNSTAESIGIHVVPDAAGALGTAGAANRIANFTLAANETLLFGLTADGYPLTLTDTNDSIQMSTSTANKVTVLVFGDKE